MSIALPKDAEGREIPLDTTTLYTVDGTQCDVSHFTYYPKCKITEQSWHVVFDGGLIKRASRMHLTTPDSWEKLEEDLGKVANDQAKAVVCSYFDREAKDCEGCKFEYCDCACSHAFLKDVMELIHKLRGEG